MISFDKLSVDFVIKNFIIPQTELQNAFLRLETFSSFKTVGNLLLVQNTEYAAVVIEGFT